MRPKIERGTADVERETADVERGTADVERGTADVERETADVQCGTVNEAIVPHNLAGQLQKTFRKLPWKTFF